MGPLYGGPGGLVEDWDQLMPSWCHWVAATFAAPGRSYASPSPTRAADFSGRLPVCLRPIRIGLTRKGGRRVPTMKENEAVLRAKCRNGTLYRNDEKLATWLAQYSRVLTRDGRGLEQ